MIKQQLKYGLKNKKFIFVITIALVVKVYSVINEIFPYISLEGIIANITNSIESIPGPIDDPFNKYSLLADSLKSYILVIPILSAIPFATSYLEDIKSGEINFINIRISNIKYRISKLLSNAVIGGLAIVIPSLIYICIICIIFNGTHETSYIADLFGGMYNNLFKEHFMIYIIFHLFIEFLIGATYSTIALATSTKIKNNIAIMLSPFLFYTICSVIFSLIGVTYFSPERINQFYMIDNVSFFEVFIGLLAIFVISSSVFLYSSKKESIYEESTENN
ncbi:hypothetical protein QYB43_002867 [Clostridium perfringens]|uniref:hypothetical protein n=1 Tax=Clostridium perfringens TaxID=1502 RepID=UPI001ABA37F1|nr:hypothetical protein [Clostridium perfringens]EIF2088132.1 hypothetical protein [Clostridium perfringens]EIF2808637.1 hypothetical protein [Clostridium perfringens]ELC8311483.1 hypothetical protein [Clostridium perfringens]ELC8354939.1 hypothetical protein [Clostridium perfringens]ELC8411455.1 hypothetical protein [Clostridium perfringens]